MNHRLIHLLIFLFAATSLSSAIDYATLATKAERFYKFEEWASASAMYELMLDQRPIDTQTYAQAIVSAGMMSDSIKQISLMKRAIDNQIPFDSIFSSVEQASFSLGKARLYEQFLILVKEHQPWLSRNVDAHLLTYYTFRRDPDNMISMSQAMLQGLPDSIKFLTLLAQGYMYRGDTAKAIDTYRHILSLDATNYDANLEVGNYYLLRYDSSGDASSRDLAIRYLSAAHTIHPTPYVDKALSHLQNK